jgi:manganese/zinc/iron transport system permease protein
MSQMELFWTLDFPAAASAVLASVLCAVLGCFLLVRRSAMLGDAISHAILPGIVGSFLLVGTRSTWAMLAGAAVAGVVTSSLVDLLHRRLKLERSAATGAVFCTMFSLGVIMLEQGARNVDLDADCVLYGLLEGISWPALGKAVAAGDGVPGLGAVVQSLGGAPRQLVTLAVALVVTVLVLASLYKVMLLASFDAALADALGFRSRVIDMVFAALVAVAAVASFEAVGSILVVAMLVCPAATAAQCSDRFGVRIWLAVVFALLAAVGGYVLAVHLPRLWGSGDSVLASGMIATLAGLMLCAAVGARVLAVKLRGGGKRAAGAGRDEAGGVTG